MGRRKTVREKVCEKIHKFNLLVFFRLVSVGLLGRFETVVACFFGEVFVQRSNSKPFPFVRFPRFFCAQF